MMPAPALESFAKRSGQPLAAVEKLWEKAKASAIDGGWKESDDGFYAYVTAILKRMLKLDDTLEESVAQYLGDVLQEDVLQDDDFVSGTPAEFIDDLSRTLHKLGFIDVRIDHRMYNFKDGSNKPLARDGSTTIMFVPAMDGVPASFDTRKRGKVETTEIGDDVRWKITTKAIRFEYGFSSGNFTFVNVVL